MYYFQKKQKRFKNRQDHLALVLAWQWFKVVKKINPARRKKVDFMDEKDEIVKQKNIHLLLKLLIAKHKGAPNPSWASKSIDLVKDWEAENITKEEPEEKPRWTDDDFEVWTALADPRSEDKIRVDLRGELRTILEYKNDVNDEDEEESTD
jgi:hypothetical protein